MHKKDLTLNNQQELICHKTQPNKVATHLIILVDVKTKYCAEIRKEFCN